MHPLTPLIPSEIEACVEILTKNFLIPDGGKFHFKTVTLLEPPKAELLVWDEGCSTGPRPARRAYLVYLVQGMGKLYEAVVDLNKSCLVSNTRVQDGFHAWADGEEIIEAERVALSDPGVKAEIEKFELPPGTAIVSDPWIYGSDGVNDERVMFQCFLYAQHPEGGPNPDSNHYAIPLPLSPIIDAVTMKVIKIQYLPTGSDKTPTPPKKRLIPPHAEYTPEYQVLRADLKPLHIVQPEGASFTVTEEADAKDSGGAVIEWQKWKIRTSFNGREGMVLHNIHYDGRSLFYRLSLSDMNVPYGDPRPPYHKKSAFDLGDAGAGIMANNLQLGCDCLGVIHYLSSNLTTSSGAVLPMPNVICIHEQDNGIGFKHTNYRTGRAVVTRNRELVIQSIITVENYEYILAFIFNQSGELAYEVKATGILSTAAIEPEIQSVPWGTIVHPGVLAQYHQHIFSLRVDPALDGPANRVVYQEAAALPVDPDTNPFGVGYTVKETEITHSTSVEASPFTNRTLKIQSTTTKNPTNSLPCAYKILAPPFQPLLAHPSSFHHKRAEFADKAFYITAHRDEELYSGGRWTNQSRGGHGVRSWANRNDDLITKSNPVVWVQFGINHIPRTEDWPVMPSESLRVRLVPVNFFVRNPGGDVPPSTQAVNKSVQIGKETVVIAGNHGEGDSANVVGEGGEVTTVESVLNTDVKKEGRAGEKRCCGEKKCC
ncbi:hypothetical protein EX30DRAFT_363951 [Ascodesmis nigricans]|uniref:Amine oxidase n=1 Tax=Ascodesmis nigricans TaxID=341454 RepID=A0A4S2MX73_9PEZI|nr:hypothetical protein EX30DRAFT_363951 [Ascodesmis nigricans]